VFFLCFFLIFFYSLSNEMYVYVEDHGQYKGNQFGSIITTDFVQIRQVNAQVVLRSSVDTQASV